MPILDNPQKAFYDSIRPFQGKDSPKPRDAEVPATVSGNPPVGQVIAGIVFLALIALAFFAFALPEKPVGLDGKAPAAAPAAPAH